MDKRWVSVCLSACQKGHGASFSNLVHFSGSHTHSSTVCGAVRCRASQTPTAARSLGYLAAASHIYYRRRLAPSHTLLRPLFQFNPTHSSPSSSSSSSSHSILSYSLSFPLSVCLTLARLRDRDRLKTRQDNIPRARCFFGDMSPLL